MSRAEQQETRATYLLGLLCDERLRDEEAVELAELLATSDAARRRYVETVQLCVDLADWSQPAGVVPISHPAVDVAVNGHAAEKIDHARPASGNDQQNASFRWERGFVIAPAELVAVVASVGCGGGNVIDRVDVGLESFQSRHHAADAVAAVDGRCCVR